MKNCKLLLITITGCLVFSFSCQDNFLDKQPPATLAGDVITSEAGLEALLISAYNSLYGGPDWFQAMFGGSLTNWEWGDISSDDSYFGAQNAFHPIESYEMFPNDVYVKRRWIGSYNAVIRANDVLSTLWALQQTDNKIPEERARQIEAEAKFLRAYHHFQMQLVFWQIPYIRTSLELDGRDPASIPNDSEVWDDIQMDLQFAIDNLPGDPPQGDVGRIDKYAAMGLKARSHLFDQELQEAKTLCDEIINSGRFELVDHYNDNYRIDTENNVESIFEIQASVSGVTAFGNTVPVQGMNFHLRGPAAKGWGAFQPSQNLFEAYQVDDEGLPILDVDQRVTLENDMGIASTQEFQPTEHLLDPRVDWTIARRGIPFLGWGVHAGNSWIRSQSDGGPYMTVKYMHFQGEDGSLTQYGGFKNAKNFRAIRYAHVLLWRAEIAVEDGQLDYARELVNSVRERAQDDYVMGRAETVIFDGGPVVVDWDKPAANYKIEPYPAGHLAFSSPEMARKAVRLEFRLEFATEGMRFFLLRRWGIDAEVLSNFIGIDSDFRQFMRGTSYNPEVNDNWPIPQDQIDISDVLQQDPAY